MDSGLVDKVHNLFYGLEKKFNNCKIVFVDIDESKYHKYPDFGGTYQTYFRIDIPYLLPNIDKILYLDPDIVVDGDIMGLYNIDLLNYAIGTPMIHKDSYYYNDILKIPNTFGYFNGGVLLMNLKYFRENNITEKIFNYLLLTKKNYFNDQDALNAILYNKTFHVPWIYNVTEYKNLVNKGKAVIIHFCGASPKPWERFCYNPYKDLYIKYRKLSGLGDLLFEEYSIKKYIKIKINQLFSIYYTVFPEFSLFIIRMRNKFFKK